VRTALGGGAERKESVVSCGAARRAKRSSIERVN
jgi:hypothetical protein